VLYTSVKEAGQIYMPRVNWVLLVAGLIMGRDPASAARGARLGLRHRGDGDDA